PPPPPVSPVDLFPPPPQPTTAAAARPLPVSAAPVNSRRRLSRLRQNRFQYVGSSIRLALLSARSHQYATPGDKVRGRLSTEAQAGIKNVTQGIARQVEAQYRK